MATIVNRTELRKLDVYKPHAFEIVEFMKHEVVCVAYIITDEQWARFLKGYSDKKIWVSAVNQDTNTAILIVE